MKLYYFVLLQMLWISGGLVFFEGYSSVFIFLYLFSSLYFFSKKRTVNDRFNYSIWTFLFIWVLICDFVITPYPQDYLFVSIILLPLATLFVISKLDFYDFRCNLLKVTNWLMGVSLIVHLLHSFDIIQIGRAHV